MRVVVTGGAGFIGSALVDQLVKRGDQILVIDNFSAGSEKNLEEAKNASIPYEVGLARFRETSRGHIMGLDSGMMKMIVSIETRKLLGVHIIGEGATELIHIGQAVLNLEGPLEYFVENTFNYPTLAEVNKIAALDVWNRMPRTG